MKLSRIALAALIPTALVGISFSSAQEAPTSDGFTPVSWSADINTSTNKLRVSTGWKNYYDGGWKKIDLTPNEQNGTFLYDKAPYSLIAPKFADEAVSFTAKTPYDPDTRSFHAEAPVTKTKVFSGVSHVQGVREGNSIVYSGAHPLGDLIYKPTKDGFQALVRINSVPAACIANPSGNVTVPFTESYSDSLTPDNIGTTQKNVGSGWKTQRNERKIVTRQAEIWDSAGKRQPIRVNGRMSAGTLIASKELPCSFLLAATYPVLTDTTTSVTANTADGYVSYGNASWATVRGAATGDNSNTSSTSDAFGSWFIGGNTYVSYVYFWDFDTSAIPDGDTVTAASLILNFPNTMASQDHTYRFVKSTAGASITTADFDAIGDSGPGTGDIYGSLTRTAGSAAIKPTITLSSDYFNEVNKEGVSYIAGVDDHHWSNVAPTEKTDSGLGNYVTMADATGDNDPTLEITYGAASAGGSNKTKDTIIWL